MKAARPSPQAEGIADHEDAAERHGKTGDRKFVEDQKAYFAILMAEVRRMYDEGKSDYEMKPVIAEKLKAYQDWAEWDTNLGQQISLAILEIEQE